jgi:hypothetical protein
MFMNAYSIFYIDVFYVILLLPLLTLWKQRMHSVMYKHLKGCVYTLSTGNNFSHFDPLYFEPRV